MHRFLTTNKHGTCSPPRPHASTSTSTNRKKSGERVKQSLSHNGQQTPAKPTRTGWTCSLVRLITWEEIAHISGWLTSWCQQQCCKKWHSALLKVVRVGSRVSDTVGPVRGGERYLGYDCQPALYTTYNRHHQQQHRDDGHVHRQSHIAVFESSDIARTTYITSRHTLGRL